MYSGSLLLSELLKANLLLPAGAVLLLLVLLICSWGSYS
jgi:hypothetical protein